MRRTKEMVEETHPGSSGISDVVSLSSLVNTESAGGLCRSVVRVEAAKLDGEERSRQRVKEPAVQKDNARDRQDPMAMFIGRSRGSEWANRRKSDGIQARGDVDGPFGYVFQSDRIFCGRRAMG